jgi:hypothetical protein
VKARPGRQRNKQTNPSRSFGETPQVAWQQRHKSAFAYFCHRCPDGARRPSVRCRHTSVWCMHLRRRLPTYLPRPCRRCLWRRPLPHAPTQQWYLLRMNRCHALERILSEYCAGRIPSGLCHQSLSEPVGHSATVPSLYALPSHTARKPWGTRSSHKEYYGYSHRVLGVLTRSTMGTHTGYSEYSQGVLWVLTQGTLGTHKVHALSSHPSAEPHCRQA